MLMNNQIKQEDVMSEKRKNRRYPVELQLEISSLFKQDNVNVDNIKAPIEVINVSKTGLGFKSVSILPMNYYFNAKIKLGTEDSVLYSVVKIIRKEKTDDNAIIYGCEFIGMAPVLSYIFDEYANSLDKETNETNESK